MLWARIQKSVFGTNDILNMPTNILPNPHHVLHLIPQLAQEFGKRQVMLEQGIEGGAVYGLHALHRGPPSRPVGIFEPRTPLFCQK